MNGKILIYHGSDVKITIPEIRRINRPLDFGVGFYTTTMKEQAEKWSTLKANRTGNIGIVNIYELDIIELKKECNVYEFENADISWVDFIIKHRKRDIYENGQAKANKHHEYDAVIGEVADDTIYRAVEDYVNNEITKNRLKELLKFKHKNNQISFNTIKSLRYLNYFSSYNI